MSKIASFAVKLLWSSYETWSLVWAAATVTANGAASWGGAVALLIHFTEWPLWQQILVSAGVALVWLTVLNWVFGMFRKKEPAPEPPSKPITVVAKDHSAAAQDQSAAAVDDSAAAAGENAKAIKTGDHSQVIDTQINYGPQSEILSARDVLLRAVEEAQTNSARRGRSTRLPEFVFADRAHLHGDNMNWPDNVRKSLSEYRNLVKLHAYEALKDNLGYSYDYYRNQVVPVIERFIQAARDYLSTLPVASNSNDPDDPFGLGDAGVVVVDPTNSPDSTAQIVPQASLTYYLHRVPGSPSDHLVSFDAEGKPNRLVSVAPGAKIQSLRFPSCGGQIVKEENLPCDVVCGDAKLTIKRFIEGGFVVDDRSALGVQMNAEVYYEEDSTTSPSKEVE